MGLSITSDPKCDFTIFSSHRKALHLSFEKLNPHLLRLVKSLVPAKNSINSFPRFYVKLGALDVVMGRRKKNRVLKALIFKFVKTS